MLVFFICIKTGITQYSVKAKEPSWLILGMIQCVSYTTIKHNSIKPTAKATCGLSCNLAKHKTLQLIQPRKSYFLSPHSSYRIPLYLHHSITPPDLQQQSPAGRTFTGD